jgi:thioesterase-3
MKSPIFTYPLTIIESHLDAFSHVNNATYLMLLEQARWDLITKNGFGLERIMKSGVGPTILEITIRFLKELRLRENIIIETELVSYVNKIGVLNQRIMRSGEVCCEAVFKIGLFDLAERALILPTKAWLEAIGVAE